MRFFAEKCPTGLIGQQSADQFPWFHLVTLLTKVSSDPEREWYAAQAIQPMIEEIEAEISREEKG